ncbi:interferon-induced protein 44-like [Hoplias malabaricus]|uniref:interferon-induced protein 44-like n=1 Tax=Hoplias malabaricus TaxID=27720 RepID=UPI0034622D4D
MGSKQSKQVTTLPDFEKPWRNMKWNEKKSLEDELTNIHLRHPELTQLRILLHGPVGAGKSCFINSVRSIFSGEIKRNIPEQSNAKKSCTKTYKSYSITNKRSETLPFIFNDVMGLENIEDDGIHPNDIVNALLGHIKEGYKFNPVSPLSNKDVDFIHEPTLKDKVHCLVSVVPANSISRMDNGVIDKMEVVRKRAVGLEIPHLVIMTKVDANVCPLVNEDLSQIYRSRKIKEKMGNCSDRLGPTMKCIFPVSNYHEENETNDTKDVLILTALLAIVKSANEYVEESLTSHE